MTARKAKTRPMVTRWQRMVVYLQDRLMGTAAIVASIATLLGAAVAVDSFYVRSERYDGDRRQQRIVSVESAIDTLETRQAFTKYRLNDAMKNGVDAVTIQEYRTDLIQLTRKIEAKRRQLDDLKESD